MRTVEFERHIDASPASIWSFISDVERVPEWATMTEELLETSDNPLQEGSVYRERSKIGPYASESEWEVTTFRPVEVQVHETDEPAFRAILTMAVAEAGAGTRFAFRADYEMMPAFRPLGWVAEELFAGRLIEQNFKETVDNVKRMNESAS